MNDRIEALIEVGWTRNDFAIACCGLRDYRHPAVHVLEPAELLRQATHGDPLLSRYSVVILELRRRTWQENVLLGLLRKIRQRHRPELRVVVSTDHDAEDCLEYLTQQSSRKRRRWDTSSTQQQLQKGVILSQTEPFTVDCLYLEKATSSYVRSAMEVAARLLAEAKPTDTILCFLPTRSDIDAAMQLAEETIDAKAVVFQQIFAYTRTLAGSPPGKPRILLATDRTPIVPNVQYVIDAGWVRLSYFDVKTGLDRSLTVPTSRQEATARARLAPHGQCFRLYPEKLYRETLPERSTPEMLRCNLTACVLTIKALGVQNVAEFEMLDTPSSEALQHALESLYALDAIDDHTNLTARGLDLSSFPTEPRISRMLLESLSLGCSWDVLSVASALQVRDIFLRKPRGAQRALDYEASMTEVSDPSGDHVTLANVLSEFEDHGMNESDCRERYWNYGAIRRALSIRKDLAGFLRRFGKVESYMGNDRSEVIRKCVTAGFFFNVAHRSSNDGRYSTLKGKHPVAIAPSSVLHQGRPNAYVLFSESVDDSRGEVELRCVSSIEAKWLREMAPHYWK